MNGQFLPKLIDVRPEGISDMRTSSQRLPAHAAFTGTASQIMPGVMIGCMFVLTSVAFSSLTDREVLLLNLNTSAREAAVDTVDAPTVVRSFLHEPAASVASLPVVSRKSAVKNGIRNMGYEPTSGTVERVTLEIAAGYYTAGSETRFRNRKELLQMLSRHRDKLELRMTLRVSPEHLADAVRLATDVSKDEGFPAAQIVISADNSQDADSLFVDVFRTVRLNNVEVATR